MPPRAKLKSMPEPQRDPLFGTSPDLKEIVELSLSAIELDPNQPRQAVDEKKLEELALSIREHGLLQPITVRRKPGDEGYVVVAGERRFRAHKLLGRERIEAIITKIDEGRAYEVALIENLQREDLTPLEEAAGYARLMEQFGYTQEDVAEKVPCGPDVDRHVAAVKKFVDAGFSHVALVQVGAESQPAFLDWAQQELVPRLKDL